MFALTPRLLAELQAIDTPTVCNAVELLVPERRGYGYTTEPLLCIRPELKPLVGMARTATIRSAHPSDLSGKEASQLSDSYYSYIDDGPKPSVVVIQDIDEQRGYGSLWGEVNSAIHAGMGCIGLVTDGAIRDIPEIAAGFQMLAGRVVPSHAFVHVVDFGRPVNVAGCAPETAISFMPTATAQWLYRSMWRKACDRLLTRSSLASALSSRPPDSRASISKS